MSRSSRATLAAAALGLVAWPALATGAPCLRLETAEGAILIELARDAAPSAVATIERLSGPRESGGAALNTSPGLTPAPAAALTSRPPICDRPAGLARRRATRALDRRPIWGR